MRKRRWMSGLVAMTALALGVWALLHRGWDVGAPEAARGDRGAATPRATRAATASTAPRPSAGLRIRGTVVDVHGTPVAGVRVSASWPEPGRTLSELPCPEEVAEFLVDTYRPSPRDFTLLDCVWDTPAIIEALAVAREGEASVQAETTTGADGAFLLDALPEGTLDLWALGEHGVVMRPGIPAGTEGVELVLEEGRILDGTVVGESAPVPGARVTVFTEKHARYFDTTTGADGRFRVGPLPEELYFAAVTKDGWLPTLEIIDTAEQELELHRAGRLSGQVLSGGAPVPGTRVRVVAGKLVPGDSAPGITTDEQGRFSLVRPTGPNSLSVSHEGRYALAHVTVGSTPTDVVLELGSALRVEGTVSDDSGRPVAGARMTLRSDTPHSTPLQAVTGVDGRYSAGPVEPGVWSFDVDAPGYSVSGAHGEYTVDTTMRPLDIVLPRAFSVTGLVTDAEGQVLPGVELVLVRPGPPDAPRESERLDTTKTDAEGRFILDAKEAGDYRIDVGDAPFLAVDLAVHAPSSDVHLALRPGASVEGTVVDSHGLPLHDFLVELQQPEGREELDLRRYDVTDARGHFLLQGVKPGRYLLLASDDARDLTHRAWCEVALRDGERTQVELRMEPERTLSARVVDGSGRPVPEVFVRARPPREDAPAWKVDGRHSGHGTPAGVQTDADGRVTLRGLTEATYDVSARKNGYTLDTGRSTGGTAAKDGELLRVGADTAEVRLVMKREAHIIGRVVGPDGAPVRHFEAKGRTVEDTDGAFALPLSPGDDSLVIEAEGLAPLLRALPPAREGADVDVGVLRMHRGRTLRGRVVDAETSAPVPRAHLDIAVPSGSAREPVVTWRLDTTQEDGTFELSNAAPEPFALIVSRSGYLDRQLTVSPEQQELTFRMERGAFVEVTVKDREGRPLPVHVQFRGDDGDYESGIAEKGQLVQRGLAPGPYTVVPTPTRYGDRNFPVFLPQQVVVPASGRLQLHFEPQEGGTTVTLRIPGGSSTRVALVPGSIPPFANRPDVARAFARALPRERTGDEHTFQHVPAGRATLFVFDASDYSRFHREELDVPASGTLSREVTPRWRAFE